MHRRTRPLRRTRAVCCALSISLAFAYVAPAIAEPKAADVSAARDLAKAGVAKMNAGDCVAAIELFAQAEKLFHAPTILVRIGECQVRLGKLVEGTENLERVAHEPLGDRPQKAFVEAVERAKTLLSEARPKIAKLVIVVPSVPGLEVRIDGDRVHAEILSTTLPIDPGAHTIEANATGRKTARAEISLGAGESKTVTLSLENDPDAVTAPSASTSASGVSSAAIAPSASATAATSTTPSATASTLPPAPPSRLPAIVSFAAGGAGIALGVTFGALALSKRSSLADQCGPSKLCPVTARGTLGDANTFADVSTVAFGVGIAGAAVGAVLWLTMKSPSADDRKASWTPWVGLGSAGISGRF